MKTLTPIPCTKVEIAPGFGFSGSAPRRLASIGSCFSEKAVAFLRNDGFECVSNPTGIVYNPVSIASAVRHAGKDLPYTEKDFFEFDGKWHSREHHGSFSRANPAEALAAAEESRRAFRDFLREPCPVVLTPATAVVFREKSTGRIVANCHKVPGTAFERELLPYEECVSSLTEAAGILLEMQPEARIVFSVSPVRHHPGDPVLNARSKALLIAASHAAAEAFRGKCFYFPAWEILCDELRDYRFYAEDAVHPSPLAERIIVESFVRAGWGEQAEGIIARAEKNSAAKQHIPGGVN